MLKEVLITCLKEGTEKVKFDETGQVKVVKVIFHVAHCHFF